MNTTNLKPFAITYTDGYYSVRQAKDVEHVKELSKERHPTKTVATIREVT